MSDPDLDEQPPVQGVYPSFVDADDEGRRRWDLCVALAARELDEPAHTGIVRSAAGVLYRSDIPT